MLASCFEGSNIMKNEWSGALRSTKYTTLQQSLYRTKSVEYPVAAVFIVDPVVNFVCKIVQKW